MKISLNWLKDYLTLNDGVTPSQLEEGLVQLGHEVEGFHDTAAAFANVVVGHVVERVPHPQSDHLGVCQVDVGSACGGIRQIVCGAPNARAGLTVAVALPGAVLPGDFAIKPAQIRGVASNGMICSVRELGMGDEHNGIWEMDVVAPVGTPLADALNLGDVVLDVSVTPNRGDCLSHLGIARDLAALGLGTLKAVEIPAVGSTAPGLTVATETPGCPVIFGVRVSGVVNGPSPAYVRARLEAVGVRPKNILVDATNYVMLALGQPLHAYDAHKVDGGIVARSALDGEAYKGLNDVELALRVGDVVIADGKGPVGLGGILGGEETAVSDTTTDVFLEAAHFDRAFIARTGQAHGVITDARYRFERGVDPAIAEVALKVCAGLMVAWGGGEVSAVVSAGALPAAPAVIAYDPDLCRSFGGLDVPPARQKEILTVLGFGVEEGSPWRVSAPSFRTYMVNPEDVVEEILRVVGYETIPEVLPPVMPGQFAVDGKLVELDRRARKTLAMVGFLEGITYSFISRQDAERFAAGAELLELANPLAMDTMTTLRPSLIPGLLRAVKGNLGRKENAPRLAEVGKVYHAKAERLMAAGILVPDTERTWRKSVAPVDVFAAKGALMSVLEALGAPVDSCVVDAGAGEVYHPGQSGVVRVGPFVLGKFGMLHPAVVKAFEVPAVAVFEVELEALLKVTAKVKPWVPSAFPPVARDVAFVLPKTVPAADVVATIRKTDKDLLKQVAVFDMYQGDKVPDGMKSLALGLTLQALDRTLTEADIVAVVDKVVAAVQAAHGGVLRG